MYSHSIMHRGVKPQRENQYWVPTEAHRVSTQFLNTYLPSFPPSFFSDLLVSLNSVWKQREERKLERMRRDHEKDLEDVRRRYSQRVPMDKVLADRYAIRITAWIFSFF